MKDSDCMSPAGGMPGKGRHIVVVCANTFCRSRGSKAIYSALRQEMELSEGRDTTADGLFTLETVSCFGACGLAPVMMVDGKILSGMTPEKAVDLIREIRGMEEQKLCCD